MKVVLLTVLFHLTPVGGDPTETMGGAEQMASMKECQAQQQVRAAWLAEKYKQAKYKDMYFTVACLSIAPKW